MQKENVNGIVKQISRDPKTMYRCPHCDDERRRMVRRFFSEVYRVEIDQCMECGHMWFDKNELEVLQYLIEEQTKDK
jgi:Zn-finger nucleic acid-binding protein